MHTAVPGHSICGICSHQLCCIGSGSSRQSASDMQGSLQTSPIHLRWLGHGQPPTDWLQTCLGLYAAASVTRMPTPLHPFVSGRNEITRLFGTPGSDSAVGACGGSWNESHGESVQRAPPTYVPFRPLQTPQVRPLVPSLSHVPSTSQQAPSVQGLEVQEPPNFGNPPCAKHSQPASGTQTSSRQHAAPAQLQSLDVRQAPSKGVPEAAAHSAGVRSSTSSLGRQQA
jgi:hypothetical protein